MSEIYDKGIDEEDNIVIGDDGEEIKEYEIPEPDPMDLYHAETDLMDEDEYCKKFNRKRTYTEDYCFNDYFITNAYEDKDKVYILLIDNDKGLRIEIPKEKLIVLVDSIVKVYERRFNAEVK